VSRGVLLTIISALASLVAMNPSHAADVEISEYSSRRIVPRQYSWEGLYFGFYGGGAIGRSSHDVALPASAFSVKGPVIGGIIGYNFKYGGSSLASNLMRPGPVLEGPQVARVHDARP
jgi:hypothetical protein